MGFSRQEYWSRLPFLSQGDLPYQGIEPVSLTSPALAGRFSMMRSIQTLTLSFSKPAFPWDTLITLLIPHSAALDLFTTAPALGPGYPSIRFK